MILFWKNNNKYINKSYFDWLKTVIGKIVMSRLGIPENM